MARLRVFSVVGARPQFIKAAPLSAALRARHDEFLVHTGQHYDDGMSDVFFRELGIPQPDVNLGVGSGGHAEQTAAMLIPLERLLRDQRPDWVLVYGDTNSTLAGALAAAKLNLRVAHVEAGLRSYNRAMPEEINRVLTDHLSALLLCPTPLAADNLAREGVARGVVVTGDIMTDAVYRSLAAARRQSRVWLRLGLDDGQPYIAATIHRPANTDDPAALAAILAALAALPHPVIFPAHPRTRKMIERAGLSPAGVRLIEPLGYLDMLALVDRAALLITDSGGLQKEAYLLRTPCVTVRTETEWPETVASGWNRLAAAATDAIRAAAAAALGAPPPAEHPDFYGDGQAAARIVAALEAG